MLGEDGNKGERLVAMDGLESCRELHEVDKHYNHQLYDGPSNGGIRINEIVT